MNPTPSEAVPVWRTTHPRFPDYHASCTLGAERGDEPGLWRALAADAKRERALAAARVALSIEFDGPEHEAAFDQLADALADLDRPDSTGVQG